MDQQDHQDHQDQPGQTGRGKDRGKFIFLAIIVVAVFLVYISQRSGAELPKWPGDLAAALSKAEKEDRKILVFFAGYPPSTDAREMSRMTLVQNSKHIKDRKLITVLIQLKKTDDMAKRYKISDLPTFLLLDPKGKELNRRVGFVGQAPFSLEFLDCSKVQKP